MNPGGSREDKMKEATPLPPAPVYRVLVRKMVESNRISYWTTIVSPDRRHDAKPWDAGIISPFMSEDLWKAEHEAKTWARFFGVAAELYVEVGAVLPDHEA